MYMCMYTYTCTTTHPYVCTYTHGMRCFTCVYVYIHMGWLQSVALINLRSLLQNIVSFIGLFCKKDLQFIGPTNQSHTISRVVSLGYMCTYTYQYTCIHISCCIYEYVMHIVPEPWASEVIFFLVRWILSHICMRRVTHNCRDVGN